MSEVFLRRFGIHHLPRSFLAVVTAVLLAYPHPIAAQSVGPSGCVANCGSGGGGSSSSSRSGGGGGYNPYAGAAAGALGAFMQGFMNEMLRQPSSKQQAYALNEQGNTAYKRNNYSNAIRLYEAALRLSPYDSVIRNNLKNARRYLEKEREKAKWNREYEKEKMVIQRRHENVKDRMLGKLTNFSDSLKTEKGSGAGMEMMSFDDPILTPEQEPSLQEEKVRVSKRLGEVEDKILKAPPGKSAWDGGYGGTLDSPEVAGVSKPVTGTPPAQTGVPRYEKAAPVTQTDVAMLGAKVSKEEKAKNAEAAVSLAGMLAKKEDYDGALRYLKEAKRNNPDQPGLGETIAYVKGMKAANSPELAARLKKSPSPKAEIILDALTVGDGNWQASISYLEGMKQKAPADPHVAQALNYTRGMYDYQVLKQSRTIDPKLDKEAPLFFSGTPGSPKPGRATDEQIRKQSQTIDPKLDQFIVEPSLPSRHVVKPAKVDQALLARFEGPKGRALARHLMDQEVRRILKGIDEKYVRTTAGEGLDAIGREDFATAHRIFGSLHQEYPDNINLRDTANYVAGLFDAQRKRD